MFSSVSLALLAMSVVSNVLTFTPSETEWTAPGVEVEELACIDLLAYGESMNRPINRYGSTHLACQAFFVEREDGIKWRVDIVYRDKVVVLEQDRELLEFYPGFNDCRYAIFSPNGRYVMVGAETGTEDTPECIYTLIDLEEETSIRFQRAFDVALEPVFWVSTDGSVAMLAHGRRRLRGTPVLSEVAEAPDTLFLYNDDLTQVGFHVTPIGWPRVRRSDDGNTMVLMERGGELIGLDSAGTELWSRHDIGYDGEDSQLYCQRISGDGSLFLSSRKSGVYAYDARTGEHLYTTDGYQLNPSLSVSYRGSFWGAVYKQPSGVNPFEYMDVEYLITWDSSQHSRTIAEICFDGGVSVIAGFGCIWQVFEDGTEYMSNPSASGSHSSYLYLLSADGQIPWQSQTIPRSEMQFSGNVSARSWCDYEPNASYCIEDEMYAVAYINENEVIVKTISITK